MTKAVEKTTEAFERADKTPVTEFKPILPVDKKPEPAPEPSI